jgi:hypothetical protein
MPLNVPLRSASFPPFRLHRQRLVEVRSDNRNVVDALALFGKEARGDAFVVERLDRYTEPLRSASTHTRSAT